MPDPRRLLILGGTAEAAAIAAAAAALPGLTVMSSLAGRTAGAGRDVAGSVRIGGFGGADGLAAFLAAERIDAVIDATHPFAAAISAHARAACDAVGVARLVLTRPMWRPEPGDVWIEVETAAGAAARVPDFGRSAFLTVGFGSLAPFAACAGVRFLVRLVDPRPLPLAAEIVLGKGPFAAEDECALMRSRGIDLLVSKASGGPRPAKLDAARTLALPVLLLRRPPTEPGDIVETVAAALAWLRRR